VGRARTAGWAQPGWRQAGKAASTGSGASFTGPGNLRRSTGWNVAGIDPSAGVAASFGFTSGTGTDMVAIPEFFDEAGTLTELALLAQNPFVTQKSGGWLGVARNKRVGSDFFPDVTVASVDGRVNNTPNSNLGGGAVSVAISAGDIIWFVYQYNVTDGLAFGTLSGVVMRQWGGVFQLEGKTVGAGTVTGIGVGTALRQFYGYRAAGPPAYAVGGNFPTAGAQIVDYTSQDPFNNPPALFYQFART